MSSAADAKVAIKAFKGCVKEKGVSACAPEKKAAVGAIASTAKGECAPFVEDFFSCFQHRYSLSSCSDATVSRMLKCQAQFSGQLLSSA
mmetsp:Transcript_66201/g.194170  ORF Transcript_66201/g.194170 Transcript_66201/m.194170 type:complete len:89 (+) Transcript_66201:102-368(+)